MDKKDEYLKKEIGETISMILKLIEINVNNINYINFKIQNLEMHFECSTIYSVFYFSSKMINEDIYVDYSLKSIACHIVDLIMKYKKYKEKLKNGQNTENQQ